MRAGVNGSDDALEDKEERLGYPGCVALIRSGPNVDEPCLGEVTDDASDARPKDEAVADKCPRQTYNGKDGEALEEGGDLVLSSDKASVEDTEGGNH